MLRAAATMPIGGILHRNNPLPVKALQGCSRFPVPGSLDS
jgi:hypothetical protein